MAIKFEKVVAGATLYDRHKYRMGNTTLHSLGEWRVRVVSVDPATRSAEVSWNGNRPERWHERQLAKLHDWSMHDEGVEVRKGMCDAVLSVKRVRKPKAVAQ
jgi:heat shock protein HspQ